MILRRYGAWYHSVEPNFNPAAMTEVGFRRDRVRSVRATEFADDWRLVESHDISMEADAPVQRDAERSLLRGLEASLRERVAGMAEDQVAVVANGRDDWPKTRERREGIIVDGENRFHFHWWVDPPLKVEIHAKR